MWHPPLTRKKHAVDNDQSLESNLETLLIFGTTKKTLDKFFKKVFRINSTPFFYKTIKVNFYYQPKSRAQLDFYSNCVYFEIFKQIKKNTSV